MCWHILAYLTSRSSTPRLNFNNTQAHDAEICCSVVGSEVADDINVAAPHFFFTFVYFSPLFSAVHFYPAQKQVEKQHNSCWSVGSLTTYIVCKDVKCTSEGRWKEGKRMNESFKCGEAEDTHLQMKSWDLTAAAVECACLILTCTSEERNFDSFPRDLGAFTKLAMFLFPPPAAYTARYMSDDVSLFSPSSPNHTSKSASPAEFSILFFSFSLLLFLLLLSLGVYWMRRLWCDIVVVERMCPGPHSQWAGARKRPHCHQRVWKKEQIVNCNTSFEHKRFCAWSSIWYSLELNQVRARPELLAQSVAYRIPAYYCQTPPPKPTGVTAK